MATTRLRRTFQYPSEESSDEEDIPKEMDEEGRLSGVIGYAGITLLMQSKSRKSSLQSFSTERKNAMTDTRLVLINRFNA